MPRPLFGSRSSVHCINEKYLPDCFAYKTCCRDLGGTSTCQDHLSCLQVRLTCSNRMLVFFLEKHLQIKCVFLTRRFRPKRSVTPSLTVLITENTGLIFVPFEQVAYRDVKYCGKKLTLLFLKPRLQKRTLIIKAKSHSENSLFFF